MKYQDVINNYISTKYSVRNDGNLLIYEVPESEIREVVTTLYQSDGVYLRTIFASDESESGGGFKIHYVFSSPKEGCFIIPTLPLNETRFPSLSDVIYEATFYEREIATFFGLQPLNHPSLQPIILHDNWPTQVYPLRKSFPWNTRPPLAGKNGLVNKFQIVEGEGVHEIPVGPVHAGIIEPGHFRFSVVGEEILLLEPMLGFTHKGIEKLFETLPLEETIKLSERVSGDSSYNHSLSYCQAIELLANIRAPERAQFLRVLFAELERLANHFGDIGFILNDTGFSFGGSRGAKFREAICQLCEELTGSRFIRGVNTFGGLTRDIDHQMIKKVENLLRFLEKDFTEVIEIIEDNDSVINRLKKAGTLPRQAASDHGVVGIAARAAGLEIDLRIDHPYAAYSKLSFKKAFHSDSDVYARYRIRVQEVFSSIQIIHQVIKKLPKGFVKSSQTLKLPKDKLSVGMVEGWRGDIVYVVKTGKEGQITRVSVRDPSFVNWPAVPYAAVNNVVPDFPLINKSFNLSYSGFDR